MGVDIHSDFYQVLSNTPGAGDWWVIVDLTGLDSNESFIDIKVTVGGSVVNGSAESVFKADGETTAYYSLPIHCAAGKAVVVTVQSNNSGDTSVTVSGSIQPVSVNVLAMDNSVIVAIETVLADDTIGEPLKQAFIDKLIENMPDLDDISVAALRDALLNRVLAGNHDTDGTVGKLLQHLDASVASRLSSADYSVAGIAAAVWLYGDRTLSSFGSLVASIWSYATRTLTGATLGLGPDVQRSRIDGSQTMSQGSTDPLYKRVLARDGADLLPADVASITYSIFAMSDDNQPERTAVEGHENVTLTVADVLFDEVRSDQWASNYNFKHIPDISENDAFTQAGAHYLVEYRIQPTEGQVIVERIKVRAI